MKLNLSNNHISDNIPHELTELPILTHVGLSNNQLNGKVREFRPNVSLRLEGNSIPVGPSTSPIKSTQKFSVRVLVLVPIGSATRLLLVLGLVVFLA